MVGIAFIYIRWFGRVGNNQISSGLFYLARDEIMSMRKRFENVIFENGAGIHVLADASIRMIGMLCL
jgi:hypothetical protein